jgi:hypothetical protein
MIVVAAGVAFLLSGGGGSGASEKDPKGDVVVTKGPKRPQGITLADLTKGAVRFETGVAVFEATVDALIPEELEGEAITFRWEINESGQPTWIVSASVDVSRTASVIATQVDYRSSTIDESLPGELVVEGETVRVTLRTEELEGFPSSFDWTLHTELDGDRVTAPSSVAKDSIPDEGSLRVGS